MAAQTQRSSVLASFLVFVNIVPKVGAKHLHSGLICPKMAPLLLRLMLLRTPLCLIKYVFNAFVTL